MTDAPETLLLQPCRTNGWEFPDSVPYLGTPATEYTRSDISQARIAQIEATMKKDAKIYYDAKAIIDAHQVIYREARGEQRARIAELEEALEVITARAEMATVCDNDSFNFGWMVKLARAALKAKP
jgi:hypothetical protein